MTEIKQTFDENKLQCFADAQVTKTADEAIQGLRKANQWVNITHDQITNLEALKSEINLEKELICLRCKNVPINSVFCNSCEKFYCAECVEIMKLEAKEEQKEENKEGPAVGANGDYACLNNKCKKENFETTKMTRMVRNMVDQLEFKFGDETLSFDKLIKKETEVANNKLKLKCTLCEKDNMSKEELASHVKDECEKVELSCSICQFGFPRAEFQAHNCKKCLKEKIDKIVGEMEAQKKSLEKEFKEKDTLQSQIKGHKDRSEELQKSIQEYKKQILDLNEQIKLLKEDDKPQKVSADKLIPYELTKGKNYEVKTFVDGNKSKIHVILKRNLIINGFQLKQDQNAVKLEENKDFGLKKICVFRVENMSAEFDNKMEMPEEGCEQIQVLESTAEEKFIQKQPETCRISLDQPYKLKEFVFIIDNESIEAETQQSIDFKDLTLFF